MKEYKWNGPNRENGVKKDNMFIPCAQGNRHWREFLEWEAEGNTPDPWKTPEELTVIADLEARITELEAEKEAAGLRDITVVQAKAFIDNQIDSANDLDSLKVVLKNILKKMVVFLLR